MLKYSESYGVSFTKGTTEEKLLSHFSNYTSNLEFLEKIKPMNIGGEIKNGKELIGKLIDDDEVEVLDISSILGASLDNKLVVIDEAQSFNMQSMKSIITRIKDNSKLIIIGDLKQETEARPQNGDKGFQEIITKLAKAKGVAHITLTQITRGETQREIADLLDL